MDIIDMTVVADEQGILKIVKIDARHPTKSEASAAQCQMNMICRWKAYFKDKLLGAKEQGIKGAIEEGKGRGKRPGCHGKPKPNHHNVDGHHHGDTGDKFHGQAHPHPHHKNTNIFHFVKVVGLLIMSIGLGVVAGFAVSIVGVLVGHLVIMVYRLATGKTQKPFDWDLMCSKECRARNVQVEEAEGLLNEKVVVEAASEELPAYTDSEGVIRGDEKENL